MKRLVLSILLLFSASLAFTQTTMAVGNNFRCDAASAQPINSFSEFQCRGVPLYQNGVQVDQMFWLNNSHPEQWWLTGSVFPSSPYNGFITQVTQFSLPTLNGNLPCNGSTPFNGTVAFTVDFTDENGIQHSGTFSGSWGETKVCGRTGWYAPVLKAWDQVTIN
jgi:hypothetical protein